MWWDTLPNNPALYDPKDYNQCDECGEETKKPSSKCWHCDKEFDL